jgi:hypothetical protein
MREISVGRISGSFHFVSFYVTPGYVPLAFAPAGSMKNGGKWFEFGIQTAPESSA